MASINSSLSPGRIALVFPNSPGYSLSRSGSSDRLCNSPEISTVEERLPELDLGQTNFLNLPTAVYGPLYVLADAQKVPDAQVVFYRTMADGKEQVLKIKHEGVASYFQRSLYVIPAGRFFMLFTRVTRAGDERIGKGGFKKHSLAVDVKTLEKVDFCSVKKCPSHPNRNFCEYMIQLEVMKAAIPGSFLAGETADSWLERLEDGDLHRALETFPHYFVDPDFRRSLALQMAEQVALLHDQDILHRDIKIANFLYSEQPDGTLKIRITDFGLAVKKGEVVHQFGGSLINLSPESVREHALNAQREEKLPYTYVTEAHDGWQLGIAFVQLFFTQLSQDFQDKNEDLAAYISSIQGKSTQEIWSLLRTIWVECDPPLTQSEWMQEPEDKTSLEYVIYRLLMIDPLLRWTPKQAADLLRMTSS